MHLLKIIDGLKDSMIFVVSLSPIQPPVDYEIVVEVIDDYEERIKNNKKSFYIISQYIKDK